MPEGQHYSQVFVSSGLRPYHVEGTDPRSFVVVEDVAGLAWSGISGTKFVSGSGFSPGPLGGMSCNYSAVIMFVHPETGAAETVRYARMTVIASATADQVGKRYRVRAISRVSQDVGVVEHTILPTSGSFGAEVDISTIEIPFQGVTYLYLEPLDADVCFGWDTLHAER
jgi:hypothetical protein